MTLNADKCPLQEFLVDPSIDLWWNAKQRKPAHGPRKQYKKCCRKERKSSKEKQTVTRAQFEGRET